MNTQAPLRNQQLDRRAFLAALSTTALSAAALASIPAIAANAAAPLPEQNYSGNTLNNWEVVIGDGILPPPEQDQVDEADIETIHLSNHSELKANINMRPIMAHNITFNRIIDNRALQYTHHCGYKFRMPYLPGTANPALNGQTVEGGIFIWDGGSTRLDYGLAFQWVVNPWAKNFGDILQWTGTTWAPSGHLDPNTDWHNLSMTLDPQTETATLSIDDQPYPIQLTQTPKSDSWGAETAARLQAEIISPSPNESGPSFLHKAEFKDWFWDWKPHRTIFLPAVSL